MFYCLDKTPLFPCLIGVGFVSLVFCFVEKCFSQRRGDVGVLMHLCFTCRNQQMLLNPRGRQHGKFKLENILTEQQLGKIEWYSGLKLKKVF